MRSRWAVLALSLVAAAAVAAVVAFAGRADGPPQRLAASTAPASTAPASPAPTPAPTAEAIPEVAFGTELEGGRTYALPGGAWIFDVPEGMRLRYNSNDAGDPPNGFGFKDQVTGSLITVYLRDDGSFTFYGLNYGRTAAARQLADAWLPAVEASFRRPPGYVQPSSPGGASGSGPGANPGGVPYLRDYRHSGEVFAGGYTYATPDGRWLVDVPAGIRVRFYGSVTVVGPGRGIAAYSFHDDADTERRIVVSKATARVLTGTSSAYLDMLAASFRRVQEPGTWISIP